MSSSPIDTASASAVIWFAKALDGALLGLTLGAASVHTWLKHRSSSSALRRVRSAHSASRVADLRLLLEADEHTDEKGKGTGRGSEGRGLPIVVFRGRIEPLKSHRIGGGWKDSSGGGVLTSEWTGDQAVVLQRNHAYVYTQYSWSGKNFGLFALFARSRKDQTWTSIRTVPFNLVDVQNESSADKIRVNVEGSTHPLPLTAIHHHLTPVRPSPSTFMQAFIGNRYPVGVLDEEKILPIGKEITAVGLCSSRAGVLEIKPCNELPFFLSEMTKDQLEEKLAITSKLYFYSGIILGTLSLGILGYSILRNWQKWKDYRKRNQQMREEIVAAQGTVEDLVDVPEGELCVICLMRRRRSAFVPCGHLVCCPGCAFAVEHDRYPKCPVCRQEIRSTVRIYDS
ncbi:hypothetical protein QJS10_CPB12g01778 [Acorus calamus]|uniref:RING-type E3 ubiquitin transferase n=1 Tax=Acorus calamus TaxID=4465 RepID=A0AAV9DNF1_ACOCL|nr:hypothetical protein QJS10_CPB12g01778 [Acorus calamus]